jgi:hypothetical protein
MTDFSKKFAAYRPYRGRQTQVISWVMLSFLALAFTFHKPTSIPRAPVPAWQQAMPLGTEVKALALADDGDVYMAGTFEGTVPLGQTTLTSAGGADIFITRFDVATGTLTWAQRAGGAGEDVIKSLAISCNQVYMAGYAGRAGAGPTAVAMFDTIKLTAQGTANMFIAKLEEQDGRASFRWVQGMAGVRASEVQQMTVKNENIYIAGSLDANDVYFGIDRHKEGKALPRDSTRYHHSMYVARLSDLGADVKGASMLFIGFDRHHVFTGLVADAYPDVYLAGNFEKGPVTFIRTPNDKPGTGKATHMEAQIHKFTDENQKLQPIWDYTLGDSSETTINALAVQGDRLYAAGTFLKKTHFKDIKLATLTKAGYLACFISGTYAADPVWAVPVVGPAGPAARCQATALALHDSAVYIAGRYEAAPQPQAASGGQPKRLVSGNSPGIFVSHLLDTGLEGQVRWQQAATASDIAQASSLVTNDGLVYMAGSFTPAIQFGHAKLSGSKAPQKRVSTGFWAKLGTTRSKGNK